LYIPGATRFETVGRPIEILIEQLAHPPSPPPKGLLDEWVINSLLEEPWFVSRVKKIKLGKWTGCTKGIGLYMTILTNLTDGRNLNRLIDLLANNKAKLGNIRDIEIGSANVNFNE
jgi:hypothetical protein